MAAANQSDRGLTRRRLMKDVAAAVLVAPAVSKALATTGNDAFGEAGQPARESWAVPYSASVLPAGVRSRFVNNGNGAVMHTLEAGFESRGRPGVLLLHGFPELAYSWRKVIPRLAAAGYHVMAPDLRGYGRTTGWDVTYDDDIAPYRALNHTRDMIGLVAAFGHRSVAAVVGHDHGAGIVGWCALARPDIFRSVVIMSSPFGGAPSLQYDTADKPPAARAAAAAEVDVFDQLAKLNPPRKQYGRYNSTRQAAEDWRNPPQGIHAFLRAYFHMKSADWKENKPFRLKERSATELAKLPPYYMMHLDKTMPQTVAEHMPTKEQIAACKWLTEDELHVYSTEFSRTGFQGRLQVYRGGTPSSTNEAQIFAGKTIDQPSMFISGKADWGVFQGPGALERMQTVVCKQMVATHLLDGAGHWVDQEQPEQVSKLIVEFIQRHVRG